MKDLTPARFKCSIQDACPAVFRLDDGVNLLIIGKEPTLVELATVKQPLGKGEWAVVISEKLVRGALAEEAAASLRDTKGSD